jgi:hypothetical protein
MHVGAPRLIGSAVILTASVSLGLLTGCMTSRVMGPDVVVLR